MTFSSQSTPRRPSPAVAFIGRKNSGKTTLVEQLIARLTRTGLSIGSIKHHGHPHFDIDVPGKDSYRHHSAGARATAVLSQERFALMKDLEHEMTCQEVLNLMPGYDLVIVEGFRKAGLPCVELFREDNPRDREALPAFIENIKALNNNSAPSANNNDPFIPPVAIVSDIPCLIEEAEQARIPIFGFNDIEGIARFLQDRFVRKPLTIAIQAGGESKRMGHSKARMPFLGRPLIEHMLDLVMDFGDEIIITTNEPDVLAYLPDRYPGIRLEHDLYPERGALPGLYTALHCSSNDLVGVVACDMIAFSPRILMHEALVIQAEECDAVVPFNDGFWEPFAGVYRASTCEPILREELERGTKRIQDFYSRISCRPFANSHDQRRGNIDPFANINTQEELAQAEILYRLYDK